MPGRSRHPAAPARHPSRSARRGRRSRRPRRPPGSASSSRFRPLATKPMTSPSRSATHSSPALAGSSPARARCQPRVERSTSSPSRIDCGIRPVYASCHPVTWTRPIAGRVVDAGPTDGRPQPSTGRPRLRVVRPGRREGADARGTPLPDRPQHRPQRERGRAADHEPVAPERLRRDRRAPARSPSGGPRRRGSRAGRSAGCRCRGRSAPAREGSSTKRSLMWMSWRPIGTSAPMALSCTGMSSPGAMLVGRPFGSSGVEVEQRSVELGHRSR